MDGWGSDLIDPWEFAQPGFVADYINLRLITRDENMKVQPLWAVEWSQNDKGIEIKLHPKAVCQNGEKADAAMLQKSLEGSMGLIEGFKGALNAAKVKGAFEAFEVRGDHHLFIKTKNPDPGVFPVIGGHNYHLWWYGPAQYLLKVGHAEYVKNPVGCGPYKIKEYKPGDRVLFEHALAVTSDNWMAHNNLGGVLAGEGRYDEAIAHCLEALRIKPGYADAHYNMALLCEQTGDFLKATRHWKCYLKVDASSSWANIARRQLEKLRQITVVSRT